MTLGNGTTRKPRGQRPYFINVNTSVDPELKEKLDLLFHDPHTGRPRHGYFSQLIDDLLRRHIKKLDPTWAPVPIERTTEQSVDHLTWKVAQARRRKKRDATLLGLPEEAA